MKYHRLTRRALISVASSIGLAGVANAEEDDEAEFAYSLTPYGEQGYGGSNSDCFIATAACGTTDHEYVLALRQFRDNHLLTNPIGRALVRGYYATSPPIAKWIANSSRRQRIVRRTLIQPAAQLAQNLK